MPRMEIRRSFSAFVVMMCAVVVFGSESQASLVGRSDTCPTNVLDLKIWEEYCYLHVPELGANRSHDKHSHQSLAQNTIHLDQDISLDGDSPSPLYTISPIEGKGLGLLATTSIPRGTHILTESPLITVSTPPLVPGQGFPLAEMVTSIDLAFSALTPTQQTTFLSLHDHRFPGEEDSPSTLTIFRSNAYNTGNERVGLFPKTARINHSCKPNAVNYWSEKLQKRIIYAGRDIVASEEITVSYIPLLKKTAERQRRLAQYGFVCSCEACAKEEGENGDKGKKRVKIADLLEVLEGKVGLESKKKDVNERLAKRAEKLVGMVAEEGLVDYEARCLGLVALFRKRAGELKGARVWARRWAESLELAEKDSEESVAARKFLDGM